MRRVLFGSGGFVLLLMAACAAPAVAPNVAVAHAERLPDGRGLENVARVSPVLYRGAQPDDEGYAALRELGVKTVVSLRHFHSTREATEAAGLDYVAIPIYAAVGSSAPTAAQVKQFFDTVLDPDRQPVYLHCKYGKDRTGMMTALYRIECQGWSNEQALAELQAFGYRDVYRDMIRFVRDYQPRGVMALPQ